MSFYTTKPVKYLRVPSQLYALDFADTVVSIANHVFAPAQTANSERDVLALRKARHKHHNAPVISLCKHAPGDLNYDISRVYDEDLNFLRFSGFKELSRATYVKALNLKKFRSSSYTLEISKLRSPGACLQREITGALWCL
jgi:hypothetical protein